MLILTVNCGSSSLKMDLVDCADGRAVREPASISIRGVGRDRPEGRIRTGESQAEPVTLGAAGYAEAATSAIAELQSRGLLRGLGAVGHRVVHGGPAHDEPAVLDAATLRSIEAATELAPLHNRPALEAIGSCREALGDVPMVATFDTAFFHDLPLAASTYALPADLASKFGIKRYGFHGLAHRYMARRFCRLSGREDARIVSLQLGGGCSGAAIRGLWPMDTSMGFTPLEGLVMGTRSGDIDGSIPGYIAAQTGIGVADVEELLNTRSGLFGLAGTDDMGRIIEAATNGDSRASLAIDVFCYRIRKYIGAYAAVLGGLDGLVFGGGIGENSAEVRERVCARFDWLGLELDGRRNTNAAGGDVLISSEASRVTCYVVSVEEAQIIAEDTAACLERRDAGGG